MLTTEEYNELFPREMQLVPCFVCGRETQRGKVETPTPMCGPCWYKIPQKVRDAIHDRIRSEYDESRGIIDTRSTK
jgi:hypothetical protein